MTIPNMTERENEALAELAAKHGKDEWFILTQALRLYQQAQWQAEQGNHLGYFNDAGERVDISPGLPAFD